MTDTIRKTIELSWPDVLKVASGKDNAGLPRSAASLGIDLIINQKETKAVEEYYLDGAVVNIFASGGAAVVTLDFPSNQLGIYRKCKKVCEDWLKDADTDSRKDEQLSLCIAPLALEGQVIVFYNQLMFVNGYDTGKHESRLVLGFDNNVTVIMEAEDIDYNLIQTQISEELRYYEQQLDEEIAEAIEEEKRAREQENIIALKMQQKLNHPIDELAQEKKESVIESDSVRFTSEAETVRFAEDDE